MGGFENWCRHFNGIDKGTCKAGVAYDSVRDSSVRPFIWPCFKDQGCSERCTLVSYHTPAEIAEKEREMSAAIEAFVNNLNNNICPHCKTPIAETYQVGRCVYARPCGCRLYQGKLRKREAK